MKGNWISSEFTECGKGFVFSKPSELSKLKFSNTASETSEVESAAAESLVYWKIFFDYAYYIGLSTFRFRFDEMSRTWNLVKNEVQQVISTILQVSVTWCVISMTNGFFNFETVSNPEAYFNMATDISSVAYYLVFPYMNLTKQTTVLAVFNMIQSQANEKPKNNIALKSSTDKNMNIFWKIGVKRRRIFVIIISICHPVTIAILSTGIAFQIADWDWSRMIRRVVKLSRRFFMTESPNEILVGSLSVLLIYQRLATVSLELFVLLTTMFFSHISHDFISVLHTNLIPIRIVERHKLFRSTLDCINEAFGIFGFVFTIGALPFYCEIFVNFFTSMGGFERARLSIFIVLFWTCLTVISSKHKRIGDELYKWLYLEGNYTQLTQSDLSLVLHDLSLNNLGLSAGNSLVITFGLMSSIGGLVITYVVILFQFKMTTGVSSPSNCTQ